MLNSGRHVLNLQVWYYLMKLNTFHGPSENAQANLEYFYFQMSKIYERESLLKIDLLPKLTYKCSTSVQSTQQARQEKGKLYIMKTSLFMHAASACREKEEKCFPTKKLIADHDVGEAQLSKRQPNFSFLDREKFNLFPQDKQHFMDKSWFYLAPQKYIYIISTLLRHSQQWPVATSKVQTDRI